MLRMWRNGTLTHCSGNVKWCNFFEKQFGSYSERSPIELSVDSLYDSAILLRDMYPKELKKEFHWSQ